MEGTVKGNHFLGWFLAAACILCLPLLAFGETARVVTPGGKLNMRKSNSEKSRIVVDVPNKALVEVEEIGETWSRVVYQKKTGYVKTDYLKIPSKMIGKTVYADGGTLLLRAKPDAGAPIAGVFSCLTPVEILSVENGWVKAKAGAAEGYAQAERFSYQYEKPAGKAPWIREAAEMAAQASLQIGKDASKGSIAKLESGDKVTVTLIDGKTCLIETEKGCGYVPVSSVRLTGIEDTGERSEGVAPNEAAEAAAAALKKKYKSFRKDQLYYQVSLAKNKDGLAGPLYLCGFFTEKDQYAYCAAVKASNKAVLFTAEYAGFAAPAQEETQFPAGEVHLALSAEELHVGDVLDITVTAWTKRACQYILTKDGKQLVSTKPGAHFTAAFRPKAAGEYRLTVQVSDAKGRTSSDEKTFRVTGEKGLGALSEVYSQKDGWWDDVPYRKSTMEHSGCAVFALSHALSRMGVTVESTLPERLAKTYALCLTPEGTNNERLITSASKDYGFKTQRKLIKEQKDIVKLLRGGAMFSFRVARGHIAMIDGVSEDGTMMRVMDSAPSATIERIVNVSMYYQTRSGSFRAARFLDDIPGARWYLDTDDYGGLAYWMPVSYGAKLGVRLIQPQAKQ